MHSKSTGKNVPSHRFSGNSYSFAFLNSFLVARSDPEFSLLFDLTTSRNCLASRSVCSPQHASRQFPHQRDCLSVKIVWRNNRGFLNKSFYSLRIDYLFSLKHRWDANFSLLCFVLVSVTSSKQTPLKVAWTQSMHAMFVFVTQRTQVTFNARVGEGTLQSFRPEGSARAYLQQAWF